MVKHRWSNWGDEGKGKITDMLGETSDIIVVFRRSKCRSYDH